jgi:hypothetical protein
MKRVVLGILMLTGTLFLVFINMWDLEWVTLLIFTLFWGTLSFFIIRSGYKSVKNNREVKAHAGK